MFDYKKTNRIVGLDYIRAISMLLIVLYHYTTRYEELFGRKIVWRISFPFGCYAVNTFFILTGFLAMRQLKKKNWFFEKKLFRLYPSLWACIMITSAFMFNLMPERLRSFEEILLNFTGIPAYFGAGYVDGAYWTLSVEILFYFYLTVVAYFVKEDWSRWYNVFGIWVLITWALQVLQSKGISNRVFDLIRTGLLVDKRVIFLLAGALIFLLKEDLDSGLSKGHVSCKYGFLFIMCLCTAWLSLGFLSGAVWLFFWGGAILFFVFHEDCFSFFKRSFFSKLFLFIARVSYPMYLLHQNIGYAIIRVLEEHGCSIEIWIIVPFFVSLVLATVVHYSIEEPLINCFNRLDEKKVD